jgi:hypothetical protein
MKESIKNKASLLKERYDFLLKFQKGKLNS